jgi:hypothetical protein
MVKAADVFVCVLAGAAWRELVQFFYVVGMHIADACKKGKANGLGEDVVERRD